MASYKTTTTTKLIRLLTLSLPLLFLHMIPGRTPETIILSAANKGYTPLVLNLICNFRNLSITNFKIIAFDPVIHLTLARKRIPVQPYYGASTDIAIYNTPRFKRLTKLKSRVVLIFLQRGYDVLWTDADITFFKDPLPFLQRQKGDILIQSNAPDAEPPNALGRINSGFYLVRASPNTIQAFQRIVHRANTTSRSEQPAFYDILCGPSMQFVSGDCCLGAGVKTVFLDRRLFPNGNNNRSAGEFLVHHNWVVGLSEKIRKIGAEGWAYDRQSDRCV